MGKALNYDSSPEGGALADGASPDATDATESTEAKTEATEPDKGTFDVSGDTPAQDPDAESQQTETKQDGDTKEGEGPTYEDFTLPDNYTMQADDLAVFTDIASELNADQGQAQKLVDLAVAVQQTTLEQANRENEQRLGQEATDMKDGWKQELRDDPVLGGVNMDKTTKAMDAFEQSPFSTPELMTLLTETGMLYNTDVVRSLSAIGATLLENPLSLTTPTDVGDETSPAQKMFGGKSGMS